MEKNLNLPQLQDQTFFIKALIIFRIAVISFFLGTIILFQSKFGELSFPLPVSLLISATYMLSIFYLFMLNRVTRHSVFLSFQIALDLFIETAIIYSTGGVASPFTFLYFFTIIASAIVLPRRASYVVASNASILYGVLVMLEFYQILSPLPLLVRTIEPPTQLYIFFTVLIHIAAFYLVAFLSDFLSQRLWSTLTDLTTKSRDLTYLKAFHENVIAHMGSGMLALDMNTNVISANHAAEQIVGQTLEEMKEKAPENILKIPAGTDLLPSITDEMEKVRNAEWVFKQKGGEDKFLSATATLFRDSMKEVRGYIIVFQDISHFKKMEEAIAQSERLATIGRIAAGLAHEIRNPLGSISGSIQMLKSEITHDLSPSNERLMNIILRETDRLNHIIKNFLSSSSDSHKKTKEVNIGVLINEAVILFRNDAEYSRHIEIETSIGDSVLHEADPESIKQVFWNLMINAAQAMPDGGKIKITMAPEAGKCNISISDTGNGIEQENVTKIFEPFYTTKENGTGLGLSTVLKIIENHNGAISVTSKPGNGTTFTVHLPITSTPVQA